MNKKHNSEYDNEHIDTKEIEIQFESIIQKDINCIKSQSKYQNTKLQSGKYSPKNKKKNDKAELFKTEMCKSFEKFGFCKYNNKCQFAHEASELRDVNRHPRYKTEVCKTFKKYGDCNYGTRCCFLHDEDIENKEVIQEIPVDDILTVNYSNYESIKPEITFHNSDEIQKNLEMFEETHSDNDFSRIFNSKISFDMDVQKIYGTKTKTITDAPFTDTVVGYPVEQSLDSKYKVLLKDYLKKNL